VYFSGKVFAYIIFTHGQHSGEIIATLMTEELSWWNSERSHDELTPKKIFLNIKINW
jgi:hypothetical protein